MPEVHAVGRVVTLERNVARIHTDDSHGSSLSTNLVRGEQELPWIGMSLPPRSSPSFCRSWRARSRDQSPGRSASARNWACPG